MASVLRLAFSCCLVRKRSLKLETVDEESHLIPASTEPTSPSLPNVVVVDHQKLKDRMSTIVRVKEGKMVNVNARLPFNLHNKSLSVTLDPSLSSRSASTSTNRPSPSLSLSPLSNTPHMHTQIQAHVGAPLTPIPHTPATRSSSAASRDAAESDSMEVYTRNPILNVRLVRGSAWSGAGKRRGRPRMKAMEDVEAEDAAVRDVGAVQTPEDEGALEEGQAGVSPAPAGGELRSRPIALDLGVSEPLLSEGDPYSPANTVVDGTPRPIFPHPIVTDHEGSPDASRPMVSMSPASAIEFKLQDAGAIALSWGD